MFNAYKIGVTISLLNHVSPALSRMTSDFAKTDTEAQKLQKRLDSIRLGFTGGLASIGAGIGLARPFMVGITEAEKFERAMLRIKNIGGMDGGSVAQIRSDALSGKFRGIAATETVDLFRDLHAAFGDTHEAKEFLPQFANFARITQALYGKSAIAGEEDVRALAKLAERRGGTKSPEAMKEQFDLAMRVQNASGGAVTPKDLLAFQARMGAMGIGLSNDGFMKMWALMQEQGGSKAGTALNSAMQNLVNGRGTEGSGHILRKIGWVDERENQKHLKAIYGDKWQNHLNKITADSLVGVDLAKKDMVGWVQNIGLPLINKYVDSLGIKDLKQRESTITSLLAQALSNRLGADSAALIATQLTRIMKDYHIAETSGGVDETGRSLDESPLAKIQDLKARWENGLINLGESALPVVVPLMEKMTDVLKEFNGFAAKNPGVIEAVSSAFMGLAGILVAGGIISMLVSTAKSFRLLGETLRIIDGSSKSAVIAAGEIGTSASTVAGALARLSAALAPFMVMFAATKWVEDTSEDKARVESRRSIGEFLNKWVIPEWLQGHMNGSVSEYEKKRQELNGGGEYLLLPKQTSQTIQVSSSIQIGGKEIANVVTTHLANSLGRPSATGSNPDPMRGPLPVPL